MPGPRATMPRDALRCSVRSIGLPLSRCGHRHKRHPGYRRASGWAPLAPGLEPSGTRAPRTGQDAQRLKALLEGRLKDPANAYSRSMLRLVLIACGLAALLAIAFATYQALTS